MLNKLFNQSVYILFIPNFMKVIYKKLVFNKNILKILVDLANTYFYVYCKKNKVNIIKI